MKICIAQTKSLKGNVLKNIQNHLQFIERAIDLQADLIVFPELSITGYEPHLAKKLATHINHLKFNPFQKLSDKYAITIGIGMPTKAISGINISMLIFQPNKKRMVYSKQILHADELPFFTIGNTQTILEIKGQKIGIGICYETLQREHFLNTHQNGADIYIASVAKSKNGIEKAFEHFSKVAREFRTPILMANCVGFCDQFMSVGHSAIWNKDGVLLAGLDDTNQGFLMYDTELETAEIHSLKIALGQLSELTELFQIYLNGKKELERNGIHQWTDNYPTQSIIERDVRKGNLYTLKNEHENIGAIIMNQEEDTEYESVDWKFDDSKVLLIHRLVIDPKHQRKGYATLLMDFAEDFAKANNYTSIRLDAYSEHKKVVEFYKKRQYFVRGDVYFPDRTSPFNCLEKEVKQAKSTKNEQ